MKDIPLVKVRHSDSGEEPSVVLLHRGVSFKLLALMVAHRVRGAGAPEDELTALAVFVDLLDQEMRGDLLALAQMSQVAAEPTPN